MSLIKKKDTVCIICLVLKKPVKYYIDRYLCVFPFGSVVRLASLLRITHRHLDKTLFSSTLLPQFLLAAFFLYCELKVEFKQNLTGLLCAIRMGNTSSKRRKCVPKDKLHSGGIHCEGGQTKAGFDKGEKHQARQFWTLDADGRAGFEVVHQQCDLELFCRDGDRGDGFRAERREDFLNEGGGDFLDGERRDDFLDEGSDEFLGRRRYHFLDEGSDDFLDKRRDAFPGGRKEIFLDVRRDDFLNQKCDDFHDERRDNFLDERSDDFLNETRDNFLDERSDGFLGERSDEFLEGRSDLLSETTSDVDDIPDERKDDFLYSSSGTFCDGGSGDFCEERRREACEERRMDFCEGRRRESCEERRRAFCEERRRHFYEERRRHFYEERNSICRDNTVSTSMWINSDGLHWHCKSNTIHEV